MAKKEKAPAAEDSKYNTSKKRRAAKPFGTQNEREKVSTIIRKAASLAKLKGMEGISINSKTAKALSSALNAVVKPGGKIDNADDATFSQVKSLAKDALSELKDNSYGSDVKELLNYCLTQLKSHGDRGFNAASMSDWNL